MASSANSSVQSDKLKCFTFNEVKTATRNKYETTSESAEIKDRGVFDFLGKKKEQEKRTTATNTEEKKGFLDKIKEKLLPGHKTCYKRLNCIPFYEVQSDKLKCFTYNEVKTATRNFRPANMVGNGWRESVFKGWIDEYTLAPTKPGTGFAIAVKSFIQKDCQAYGHSAWLTKIDYLGQLHHPNLVKLIGYCFEDLHYILINEFVANGSLDDHLFARSSCFQPLPWKVSMKIALDAARGLAFLHSDEVNVIHGDLKPCNILIDSNYNAKLSDFGLYGRIVDFRNVCRHAAPEVAMTGIIPTKKSDVYSFGVVLLEIMSGKRATDKNRPTGERDLVEWAMQLLVNKHEISQVMDAHLKGQYSLHEAMEVARIAIQCVSSEPKRRPNIDEVVRSLEQFQDSKDTVGGVGSSQSQDLLSI